VLHRQRQNKFGVRLVYGEVDRTLSGCGAGGGGYSYDVGAWSGAGIAGSATGVLTTAAASRYTACEDGE
jgi:hypothetical protein